MRRVARRISRRAGHAGSHASSRTGLVSSHGPPGHALPHAPPRVAGVRSSRMPHSQSHAPPGRMWTRRVARTASHGACLVEQVTPRRTHLAARDLSRRTGHRGTPCRTRTPSCRRTLEAHASRRAARAAPRRAAPQGNCLSPRGSGTRLVACVTSSCRSFPESDASCSVGRLPSRMWLVACFPSRTHPFSVCRARPLLIDACREKGERRSTCREQEEAAKPTSSCAQVARVTPSRHTRSCIRGVGFATRRVARRRCAARNNGTRRVAWIRPGRMATPGSHGHAASHGHAVLHGTRGGARVRPRERGGCARAPPRANVQAEQTARGDRRDQCRARTPLPMLAASSSRARTKSAARTRT